jgi:molybdenum ABC transporter molybdate-binding protein
MAVAMLASLAVLVSLVALLVWPTSDPPSVANGSGVSPAIGESGQPSAEPLVVYVAASNKSVFEAVRRDYERDRGWRIDVQFGPSQTLLASAEVTGVGDLYLPADDSFLAAARKRGLLDAQLPLGAMRAIVAVPRGNPRKISTWNDLLQPDIRIALGSVEASAIGKMLKASLLERGLWDALHAHTTVYKTTVNEVANDVKAGAVDAGIVFDAVLHDYPTLEGVQLEELAPIKAHVAIGVLKASRQGARARHFARYLAARDKGLARYREFGFQPAVGDEWAETPELTLYSGSMLRPAIERTITEFEQREGARVTRVYNGCGILVAQMKAGQVPDAYFACDKEFMTQVKTLFPASQAVSRNELVILVKKGNPLGIRSLKDLTKDGLRVGIGHEKQCAMGWLTQRTFTEGGIREEVMKNVAVQTPTGDMLVNQMRSGSLDAAVAYLSNAAGAGDSLDAIRIQGLACAVAEQPFGIAKDSRYPRLAERLRDAIRSSGSQERFEQEGFRWVEVDQTPQASGKETSAPPTSAPPTSAPPTSAPATSTPATSAPAPGAAS